MASTIYLFEYELYLLTQTYPPYLSENQRVKACVSYGYAGPEGSPIRRQVPKAKVSAGT
jgi:hypothetical protein